MDEEVESYRVVKRERVVREGICRRKWEKGKKRNVGDVGDLWHQWTANTLSSSTSLTDLLLVSSPPPLFFIFCPRVARHCPTPPLYPYPGPCDSCVLCRNGNLEGHHTKNEPLLWHALTFVSVMQLRKERGLVEVRRDSKIQRITG